MVVCFNYTSSSSFPLWEVRFGIKNIKSDRYLRRQSPAYRVAQSRNIRWFGASPRVNWTRTEQMSIPGTRLLIHTHMQHSRDTRGRGHFELAHLHKTAKHRLTALWKTVTIALMSATGAGWLEKLNHLDGIIVTVFHQNLCYGNDFNDIFNYKKNFCLTSLLRIKTMLTI